MKGVIVLFIIGKLNKNKEFNGFLFETYDGRYLFDNKKHSNVRFGTEDAALNFIYHCSDYVKNSLSEGDTLFVLPSNDDNQIKLRFKEGDKK